jgi:hypothetical protein
MAQVDSENTTALPVATTRRRFLSTTATLAAGSAAVVLAIPPAAAAYDPVYDAIEKHKMAYAALNAVLHEKSQMEGAGQDFDDSLEQAALDVEEAALTELIETVPPTLRGVIASMVYIVEFADYDGYRLQEDNLMPLLANLCEALQSLEVSS